MDRLYVVVRKDLEPGLLVAQACHSAARWAHVDPTWHENLIVLGCQDERELSELARTLDAAGVPVELFSEPDLNGEFTSFVARGDARRHLSHLPLVLKQRALRDAA